MADTNQKPSNWSPWPYIEKATSAVGDMFDQETGPDTKTKEGSSKAMGEFVKRGNDPKKTADFTKGFNK